NNGGDGFVAARHLANAGAEVEVLLLGDPKLIATPEARANWQALQSLRRSVKCLAVRDSSELQALKGKKVDVVIDAMLGIGAVGRLREPIASAARAINSMRAYKVAVDVPTGVDSLTGEASPDAVRCHLTVTFHDLKPGLKKAKRCTGEVVVVDIGLPREAETTAGPGDVLMALPERRPESHKGEHGRLLVVGGGSSYTGAPALVALAALRSGVDLATVAAPAEAATVVSSFSPDLIAAKLPGKDLTPEALPELRRQLERCTAAVIGPGLGLSDATKEAVVELARELAEGHPELPALFDADGLKAIATERKLLRNRGWVLTPHAREFELLMGIDLPADVEGRLEQVRAAARELGCVLLLKAHVDVIASPTGEFALNYTGNPGMTVGGTGDVLAGIVGAFLAQRVEPFRAAVAGAFACGRAGDLCKLEKGYEFTASDVVEKLPAVFSEARAT
ncbi:MAG: NAD(P)H-hydrate dehydratase, partial [Hadesarchaea archaeon]|nr:NAD(P)H-hydrate dehydratase [Hadesarchaea archaeon]